jgi:hypothetical protein
MNVDTRYNLIHRTPKPSLRRSVTDSSNTTVNAVLHGAFDRNRKLLRILKLKPPKFKVRFLERSLLFNDLTFFYSCRRSRICYVRVCEIAVME